MQAQMRRVDDVVVREAGEADVEALALVGAATLLETFAGILPGHAILQHSARHHTPDQYRHHLRHPTTRAWLAVTAAGNAPVGYSMLTEPDLPLDDLGPGDLELRRIYLFSRFQGSGVGQELMDVAVREARARRAPRLLLGVYAGNLRALRFYERNGFQQIGARQFTVGTLVCDDYVLGRSLASSE